MTITKKYDMTDATFIFPIYVDSSERLRNLRIVVDWITANFDTNIIICEQKTKWVPDALSDIDFEYLHVSDGNAGLIHRTHQLNLMVHHAKTNVIINTDSDVLLEPKQYIVAYELIRQNKMDVVYPYKGKFINVNEQCVKLFKNDNSIDHLNKCMGDVMHPNSKGGIIFFDKTSYIKGGMENENFISWGWEDTERWHRFNKLGFKVARLDGLCFHLDHPRTLNSNNGHEKYGANLNEYRRISRMNKDQLSNEVSTWVWCKQ